MTEWKKVESDSQLNFWHPEQKDEELSGEVVKREEGNFGAQYTLRKDDGSEVTTPSHKVLQARMEKTAIGQTVRIVFIGEVPSKVIGRKATQMYEVYVQE